MNSLPIIHDSAEMAGWIAGLEPRKVNACLLKGSYVTGTVNPMAHPSDPSRVAICIDSKPATTQDIMQMARTLQTAQPEFAYAD